MLHGGRAALHSLTLVAHKSPQCMLPLWAAPHGSDVILFCHPFVYVTISAVIGSTHDGDFAHETASMI
jgi:hypothetical protein